ncbi:Uncharacterised protein [uncultured archaeon]|nr:Uncharacterised protein [uncultured archaeon]
MRFKKSFILVLSLVLIILFSNLFSAYMSSNAQTTAFGTSFIDTKQTCSPGQDFLIQVIPFGCTPAVVRSDLLEETNTQVYCPLGVTQINPLIDVQAIDSVSFSGKYSPQISGVGFHYAKSALGTQTDLNTPVLNNVGYVVINLKKQNNESVMPDFVSGNLTAKIRYNVKNAFGIGNAMFSLPVLSDADWNTKKGQYSFWGGKGYVKSDSVANNGAEISLYTDSGIVSTFDLKKGETSNNVYLPGLDCQAGLKVKLENLDNPDTRAQLRINADATEAAKGEKFLDNKCSVQNLNSNGLIQQANIRCQEDTGSKTFSLSISPRLILNINGEDKEFGLGDKVYDLADKKVFLGYIGTKGSSSNKNDLFVYLVSMPLPHVDKLSDSELSSINSLVKNLVEAKATSSGVVDVGSAIIKNAAGLVSELTRGITQGQSFLRVNYGEKADVFSITDFANPQDQELTGNALEQYNNAKKDYETIQNSYASELNSNTNTNYGEEALYSEIQLANSAGQRKTALDLCVQFKQNYPNSNKDLKNCDNSRLSNQDNNQAFVTINKQVYKISLDGISEPSLDEYSANVLTTTPSGTKQFDLGKDQKKYLDDKGTSYLKLISLEGTSATIQIVTPSKSGTVKLEKDVTNDFATGYSFTLQQVNLKQNARVSIIPSISNGETSANFSFKIGIEKRAIQLSPGKIKESIDFWNKSIAQWGAVSGVLGYVTTGLKTACLATGAGLVVKNFFTNTGGEGIARGYVMRGVNGWFDKCTSLVSEKQSSSLDKCFLDNSDKIDSDVSAMTKIINAQNSNIKNLQSGVTTQFLSETVVDTNAFMAKYTPQVSSYLGTSSGFSSALTDPSGKGETLNQNDILKIISDGYSNKYYSSDQLKEIELYTKILDDSSSSAELKSIAQSRLYADLVTVKTNAGNFVKASQLAQTLSGVTPDQIGFLETNQNVKAVPYTGLTLGETGKSVAGFSSNTPIYLTQTSDGNTYLFVLDNSAGTSKLTIKKDEKGVPQIYDYNSMSLVSNPSSGLTNIYFQKYDSSTYNNKYKNPKVSYFETDPYKGLPAIVPVDVNKGWYASIKQTLPVGANIQSYDASGRVSSFYLCNVGANGIQESQTIGDDTCEMINTGTGMPYNQFPGLGESEAKSLVNKAVQAIEQASRAYKSGLSGKISILGQNIDVGTPAVDVPQFECQDFMSPKDCLLLFNLCDPVICPSSRCDFGGTYPVKNVIQSGVIGSIALCLPNAKEGIIMPVCLTGVKEGIDGFLSVQKSFKDCLQESLNTGKQVGICDEAFSIYTCDLLWREVLPVANFALPTIVSAVFGQNVKGGGEYLGIANAFSTAEKSVNYFVNYYGTNSAQAFTTRVQEVGTEFCKSSISAVLPTGGELISSLTKPDSPSQFTGRFDEIPLTRATVPPTSHYKVFYHIYAGTDSGAYYQVYLKGSPTSSYYHDTNQNLVIATGYAAVGGYATNTVDKVATSGYQQLCLNVNGQEECGFKEVSTSFAINYVKDSYLNSQASQTDIKTESDCISGTANAYSLLNPNVQSTAESIINPAIYNQGIVRICATDNPGRGTDPYAGMENSRWKEVGVCGDAKIKCWIDTQSVDNVIKTTTIQNATLDTLSQNYNNILANQNGYLTSEQFSSSVKEIENENDNSNKINLVNNIIDKTFLNSEKVQLYYLRGNAYASLLSVVLPLTAASPTTNEGTTGNAPTSISAIDTLRQQVLDAAAKMEGTSAARKSAGGIYSTCWDAAYQVYVNAGVKPTFVYSDKAGTKYTFSNFYTNNQQKTITVGVAQSNNFFNNAGEINFIIYQDDCKPSYCSTDQKTKLDNLNPGDLLSYAWDGVEGHNAIFIKWTDKANHIAHLFDWNGGTSSNRVFRYYDENIGDNSHPVYVVWKPYDQSHVTNNIVDTTAINDNPPTSVTTPTITTPSSTISSTDTSKMGYKIFDAARNIVNSNSNLNDKDYIFVSRALINAGVKGVVESGTVGTIFPTSLQSLILKINQNSDFSKVDPAKLNVGDIVIIGQGCVEPYLIGIVSLVDRGNIFVYTNLGSQVKLENINTVSSIETKPYLYTAYRYTSDLSSSEKNSINVRTSWTLFTALTKVASLTGVYADGGDNKIFVDQLVFDGLLTQSECYNIRTDLSSQSRGYATSETMGDLKNLLLTKCSSDSVCTKQWQK